MVRLILVDHKANTKAQWQRQKQRHANEGATSITRGRGNRGAAYLAIQADHQRGGFVAERVLRITMSVARAARVSLRSVSCCQAETDRCAPDCSRK